MILGFPFSLASLNVAGTGSYLSWVKIFSPCGSLCCLREAKVGWIIPLEYIINNLPGRRRVITITSMNSELEVQVAFLQVRPYKLRMYTARPV